MNEITIFKNEKFGEVRTVEFDGEVWFIGRDVAGALGYEKPENALSAHVSDEDKTTTLIQGNGSNYKSKTIIINESGLYSLIFGSKLDSAKEFKHWVTSEILPSIRKTGSYSVYKKSELEISLERAKIYTQLADKYSGKSSTWGQILDAYATKEMSGKFLLPLPQLEEKNYSATEVGKMLGISANKVGSIAKALNIKIDGEYGKWYIDKSPYSSKEVNTFRYSDKAVKAIKEKLIG